jgi:hypothetical protein
MELVQWSDWVIMMPDILKDSTNWKNIFETFFINNQIGSPYNIFDEMNSIENAIESSKNVEEAYILAIQILGQTTFENYANSFEELLKIYHQLLSNKFVKGKYKSKIFKIYPYALSVPARRATWINLFPSIVPLKFDLNWDTSLYDEFQIKLPSSSNNEFHLDITPCIPHRVFRCNDTLIYFFERSHNMTESVHFIFSCIATNSSVKNVINDTDGLQIWVSFSQKEFYFSNEKLALSLHQLEDEVKKTTDWITNLENKKIINQNDVKIYIDKFDKACLSISSITN